MNHRLEQFLDAENISQAEFADSIGVARPRVSHVISGRNRPGFDFIVRTMQRFPKLNIEWLLAGKGKMYKDNGVFPPADNDLFTPVYDYGDETDELTQSDLSQPALRHTSQSASATPIAAKPAVTDQPFTNSPYADSNDTDAHKADFQSKQRKAERIIIFYDDGTFQEF